MPYQACAITGHRPARFRWKNQENYNDCLLLKECLAEQLMQLYERGIRRFYVGGAMGVDMWCGEILLSLKEQREFSDLELAIALPFEGYNTGWSEENLRRMTGLIDRSTVTVTVGVREQPPAMSYRRRNKYMVNHADILLAVYDNARSVRSGTGMTVNYARKCNIPIILIHPDTREILIQEPEKERGV